MIPDFNLSTEMAVAIRDAHALFKVDAYPVALLLGGQPLALAGRVMKGIARSVERAGYDAVLVERSGAGVIWAVARPESTVSEEGADRG